MHFLLVCCTCVQVVASIYSELAGDLHYKGTTIS